MKIFVVTSGEYSDYGINALFSTKELAHLYIDKFSVRYSQFNDIEEMDVDDMEADLRSTRKPFDIIMTKDGEVTRCEAGSYYSNFDGIKPHYHHKDQLSIALFADDQEQAIKVANEKRLKYLLENP